MPLPVNFLFIMAIFLVSCAAARANESARIKSQHSTQAPLSKDSVLPLANEMLIFNGSEQLTKAIAATNELLKWYTRRSLGALNGRFSNSSEAKLMEDLGQASKQVVALRDLDLKILSNPAMKIRTNQHKSFRLWG